MANKDTPLNVTDRIGVIGGPGDNLSPLEFNEPGQVVEPTDPQIAEALRNMALNARAARQMETAIAVYFHAKQRADAVQRRLDRGAEQIRTIEAQIATARERELVTLGGYEQERRTKVAEERAKFDAAKKDYDERLVSLADQIEERTRRIADLDRAMQDSEQLSQITTEGHTVRLESHKAWIDGEILKLDAQMADHVAERDRILAGLAELRRAIGGPAVVADPPNSGSVQPLPLDK